MPDLRRQRKIGPPSSREIVSQKDVEEARVVPIQQDPELIGLLAEQAAYQKMKEDLVYFNGIYIEPKDIDDLSIRSTGYHRIIELRTRAGNLTWHIDRSKDEAKANKIFRVIVNKVYGDVE